MFHRSIVPVKCITSLPKGHFFGYYDKCPWSQNGKSLLAMETDFNDHFPNGEQAGIGIVDLDNKGKLTVIAQTRSWNWQQGAMLQWDPSSNDSILYNDLHHGQHVCIKYNISTGVKRILPRPIAAVDHSGKNALSINFARLYNVRKDYGYTGISDPWINEACPYDDGIYSLDLRTGDHRLLISTHQIANFEATSLPPGVRHWINHLAYNNDDTRFCFLHRYEIPQLKRFGTRLLTANIDGSDLRCLWTNHISHFDWRDSSTILAWALRQNSSSKVGRLKQKSLQLLKNNETLYRRLKMIPLLRTRVYGGAFFLFHDTTENENIYEIAGKDVLTEDGHCSYSPDRKWILMDTYPDINDHRSVLLYDTEAKTCVMVGRYFSPPEQKKELRCDLHARWDRTGTQVCIDSMHEGSRQMYILDVSEIVK